MGKPLDETTYAKDYTIDPLNLKNEKEKALLFLFLQAPHASDKITSEDIKTLSYNNKRYNVQVTNTLIAKVYNKNENEIHYSIVNNKKDPTITDGGMSSILTIDYSLKLIGQSVSVKEKKPHKRRLLKEKNKGVPMELWKNERTISQEIDYLGIKDHPFANNPFILMRRLPGESLFDYLFKNRSKLNFNQAKNLSLALLEALDFVHQKQKIHRDIKPENIIVQELPNNQYAAWIIDFGLSKNAASAEDKKNNTRTINEEVGSVAYAAPEQLNNMLTTESSDYYGLNRIFWIIWLTERYVITKETVEKNASLENIICANEKDYSGFGCIRPKLAKYLSTQLVQDLNQLFLQTNNWNPLKRPGYQEWKDFFTSLESKYQEQKDLDINLNTQTETKSTCNIL